MHMLILQVRVSYFKPTLLFENIGPIKINQVQLIINESVYIDNRLQAEQ